jgi:stage V sporulation protein B
MGESLVKEGIYNLLRKVIEKTGGIILTIALARLLLPELFGLYSLIITITLFVLTFTDLGLSQTVTRYLANSLARKKKKEAAAYFRYLAKIKIILIMITTSLLIILSKFLSESVFHKPIIFIPLIVSATYLVTYPLAGLFNPLFYIRKQVKKAAINEFFYQIIRVSLAITAVLIFEGTMKITGVVLALSIAGLAFTLYPYYFTRKNYPFLLKKAKIKADKKKKVLKFASFMTLSSTGLVLMASIDILILGAFVGGEHIGFYRAAMSLIGSLAAFLNLSAILLPVFSSSNKKEIKRVLKKTIRYETILLIPIIIGLLFFGKETIILLFGKEYLGAATVLLILSPLVLIEPIKNTILSFFNGIEKSKISAKLIITIGILNIILNFTLIKLLSPYGDGYSIIGAAIATLLSNLIFIIMATVNFKKEMPKIKLRNSLKHINGPILSGVIMAGTTYIFLYFTNFQGIIKITAVPFSICMYLIGLYLTKSLGLKEIKELKRAIFKKTRG